MQEQKSSKKQFKNKILDNKVKEYLKSILKTTKFKDVGNIQIVISQVENKMKPELEKNLFLKNKSKTNIEKEQEVRYLM